MNACPLRKKNKLLNLLMLPNYQCIIIICNLSSYLHIIYLYSNRPIGPIFLAKYLFLLTGEGFLPHAQKSLPVKPFFFKTNQSFSKFFRLLWRKPNDRVIKNHPCSRNFSLSDVLTDLSCWL